MGAFGDIALESPNVDRVCRGPIRFAGHEANAKVAFTANSAVEVQLTLPQEHYRVISDAMISKFGLSLPVFNAYQVEAGVVDGIPAVRTEMRELVFWEHGGARLEVAQAAPDRDWMTVTIRPAAESAEAKRKRLEEEAARAAEDL